MTGDQLELLASCTVRVTHSQGHGTGFFVGPKLVLTCDHVLDGWSESEPISIRWRGSDQEVTIKPRRNPEADLAMIELSESLPDQPCALFSTDSLRLHEEAYAYGYPDAFRGDSVTVKYEGPSETEEGQRLDKFKQGQARPGLSGAPLLSLTRGRVCGVVSVSRDVDLDLGLRSVPTRTVYAAFDELEELQRRFQTVDHRWKQTFFARFEGSDGKRSIGTLGEALDFIHRQAVRRRKDDAEHSPISFTRYIQEEQDLTFCGLVEGTKRRTVDIQTGHYATAWR
jgi:Trypsin-like peptidase domain